MPTPSPGRPGEVPRRLPQLPLKPGDPLPRPPQPGHDPRQGGPRTSQLTAQKRHQRGEHLITGTSIIIGHTRTLRSKITRRTQPITSRRAGSDRTPVLGPRDAEADGRRIGGRPQTAGEYFAAEAPLLRRLPDEPFGTSLPLTVRVDRYSQVTVRNNRYSAPSRLTGRRVRAVLAASDLVIYDGRAEAARHERLAGKNQSRLDLDHYLEVPVRKPGALPGATALEQARAAGKFTPVHDAW